MNISFLHNIVIFILAGCCQNSRYDKFSSLNLFDGTSFSSQQQIVSVDNGFHVLPFNGCEVFVKFQTTHPIQSNKIINTHSFQFYHFKHFLKRLKVRDPKELGSQCLILKHVRFLKHSTEMQEEELGTNQVFLYQQVNF